MPSIPESLAQAVAFHRAGQLRQAEQIYRQVLRADPRNADAWHLLGVVAAQVNQHEAAIEHIRRAIDLNPNATAFHANLGAAYQKLKRFDEAAACYRRALELNPNNAEAHNNLGVAFQSQGDLLAAEACFRRALTHKADYAESLSNLGTVLQALGKPAEALAAQQRAAHLKPGYAEAHHGIGAALQAQGRLDEALACYRRALELKPDFADAHVSLGNALTEQGRPDEAVPCFRRAVELMPDHAAALGFLVHTLQHLCCWEDLHALSERLIRAVDAAAEGGIAFPVAPFGFLTLPAVTTPEQQLRCARQWADRRLKAIGGPGRCLLRRQPAAPKAKITVAYLSADFHSHATARLIAELIEKHDRGRFAIFGYSTGPDDRSPMRARLVKAFDRFADLKDASRRDAAQGIAADGVDILVDLKGYTTDARTEILAFRPAPIQVNYLGYPGTMGAEFIDYILVDDYIVPPHQQPFFTEKVVYLPGCYQANDSRREISPRTPSRRSASCRRTVLSSARSTTATRSRPKCSRSGCGC